MTNKRPTACALVWWLAGAACQPPELPPAEVSGVTPARVWRGADVPITIEGTNFFPDIEVDARGFGADLDRDWEVFLVGGGQRLALLGEALESDTALRALVPAGFDADVYDLVLVSPGGRETRSQVTLEVRETQEEALAVSYFDDVGPYAVGEQVRFLIEAVGLDNERVITDVPVDLDLDGVAVELTSTVSFDDVVLDPDGRGLEGVLPDGAAILVVDLLSPGRLDVVARSPVGAPQLQSSQPFTLVVGGGSNLPTTIELPSSVVSGGVAAGEEFPVTITVYDELGEVVDTALDLTLGNVCGGFEADVVVRGPTEVFVSMERATGTSDCDVDRLRVDRGGTGTSLEFEVRGGEPTGFELFSVSTELQAGEAEQYVAVRPHDEWFNTTAWTGTLTLTDSAGSLTDISCNQGPLIVCAGTPTVATDDMEVRVEGDGGLQSSLPGYQVAPSSVADALRVVLPATVRAGESAQVAVEVLDAYGNIQLPEQVDAAEIALTTDASDGTCAAAGVGLDGAILQSCTFTEARVGGRITATGSGSLAGLEASSVLTVDNGPLDQVSFEVPDAVQAGAGFSIRLTATDAFGNPYLTQDDPVVELSDGSGSLQPDQALLGPDATAMVAGTLTRTGTWSIEASQGGDSLGLSSGVQVLAGPTDGLQVSVDAPWGEVGVPVDVVVESIDAYGNRTALSEALTVASRLTSAADQSLALINGVANITWTWPERVVGEVLDADSAGGFTGASDDLFVVGDCGADNPTTELLLGGADVGLACFDEVFGVATLTADLSGSSPGVFLLAGYGVSVTGPASFASVGTSDVIDLDLLAVGAYSVRAVAIDADACATEVSTTAFVGIDDGGATGPIDLQLVDPLVDVADTLPVDVIAATDCAGDPASLAHLLVRTGAGEIVGALPTGVGQAITLDVVGDGTFDLVLDGDVADNGPTSGAFPLVAGTSDGSALGQVELEVMGDAVRPTVTDQTPRGVTSGLVDTVVLTFSEPLLASSALPARFTLGGPSVVDVIDVDVVGSEITLTLDPPVDGDAGAWLLTVADDLRDLAGNRISGDWSGSRAPYVGAFGDVGAVPSSVSCPSVEPAGAFRPDGDDGSGIESDTVDVFIVSASVPAWWVADVRDAAGERIVQHWVVPTGASDVWSWDGRDATGMVVPAGTYNLEIRPDDGLGNRGTGCVVQTVVEHPFEDL